MSQDKGVQRIDNKVYRPIKKWSKNIQSFLSYLEEFDLPVEHLINLTSNHEVYNFVNAEMVHPYKWKDEALFEIGKLLSKLHLVGAKFIPYNDEYQPWCLREIGTNKAIWCHGDISPWNMMTKDGMPYKLVDWEFSGPLDPFVELARVCWLFPQLVDDDLQKIYELPSPEKRAKQVRIICEGYKLEKSKRQYLTEQIIEVVICETAHEAIDKSLKFNDNGCLWGFAWRTRSLYFIWRNRRLIENALD